MVGKIEDFVRIDEKGRVLIPKVIRNVLGISTKQLLKISVVGGKIVLEPVKSTADKYFGVVKVKKWPKDIDEFLSEVIREWWTRST